MVTDGSRVYFNEVVKQHVLLAQVSTAGGEISIVDTPFRSPWLFDLAPDMSSMLVSDARWNESPLWIVSLPSGVPRRVGNLLADYAAWTPDGSQIIFIKGTEIWKANADGSQAHKLLAIPGFPDITGNVRVSPDGKHMRFSVFDQGNALWEANPDGSGAQQLLPAWPVQPEQWAGSWSRDGRYYVFSVLTAWIKAISGYCESPGAGFLIERRRRCS